MEEACQWQDMFDEINISRVSVWLNFDQGCFDSLNMTEDSTIPAIEYAFEWLDGLDTLNTQNVVSERMGSTANLDAGREEIGEVNQVC